MQKLKVEQVCQNGLKAPVDSWTSMRILKNTQPVTLYYTFFLHQKVSTIIFIEEY